MRKQAGFSLIELVVAMAVLALIMGAMVNLFGSSTISLHTGAKQEVVYEEARLLMNELKTTLRYADKESIEPEKPTLGTNELTYNGSIWDRHMDISKGQNKDYKITVEWKDDTKKQLQVTYENTTDSTKKVTVFPKDIKNSVFEGSFPITAESITLNDSNTVIIYKIALPLQYELNGKMKTQTLETKVVPSEGEEEDNSIEAQLIRSYKEILLLGIKVKDTLNLGDSNIPAKNDLTANEWKLYEDFMKKIYGEGKINNSSLKSNDLIRQYLNLAKYNYNWVTGTIENTTTKIYVSPVCHTGKPEDIFLMGRADLTNSWYTGVIYDPSKKQWFNGNAVSTNKSLNDMQSVIAGWKNISVKYN